MIAMTDSRSEHLAKKASRWCRWHWNLIVLLRKPTSIGNAIALVSTITTHSFLNTSVLPPRPHRLWKLNFRHGDLDGVTDCWLVALTLSRDVRIV